MPRTTITWQARGEYLAGCCGVSPQQFAAGIDSAMAGNRQGLAARPASGQRAGAGTKTKRKARVTQAAGAAQ
jgi:hypothetical protein